MRYPFSLYVTKEEDKEVEFSSREDEDKQDASEAILEGLVNNFKVTLQRPALLGFLDPLVKSDLSFYSRMCSSPLRGTLHNMAKMLLFQS